MTSLWYCNVPLRRSFVKLRYSTAAVVAENFLCNLNSNNRKSFHDVTLILQCLLEVDIFPILIIKNKQIHCYKLCKLILLYTFDIIISFISCGIQARIQESVKERGGWHFSKFSTRVAKISISISSAYSHGEVYIRMLLAYSVFLWTYRETIHKSLTLQCALIWWYTKSNFPYLEWKN